jgi:CubicO group peptidase (beta-lactamase class C family)
MTKKIEIHGFCDDQFEPVKEAFAKNFEEDLDLGASLAVTIDGKYVIDIWAGYADAAQTRHWEKDTIVNVYSTTKVMTALCVLMLVDRGLIDLDAPVAKYWPEFAQAGKEKLPVRFLLSHSSGLPGFDQIVQPKTLCDWERIINILEAQKPWWEPGTKCGYHATSFGFLLGEVVRRVTGKSIGAFFRDEVAIPLKADFYIGLPEEHDSRVAELIPPVPIDPSGMGEIDPQSMPVRVLGNPALDEKLVAESLTRRWRAAEIPASNGHGNARSVARVASILACGGEIDDLRFISSQMVEKAIEEQIYDTDLVFTFPVRYGLGFGLVSKTFPLSPNPRAFYWGGWGGSHVTMDLDAKLCWAFVMNKMMVTLTVDPRTERIRRALYEAL